MDYLKICWLTHNRNRVFNGYNSADGTSQDNSTDVVITRNPNDYLSPKVNGFTVMNTVIIVAGILGVIILLPLALKTVKSF